VPLVAGIIVRSPVAAALVDLEVVEDSVVTLEVIVMEVTVTAVHPEGILQVPRGAVTDQTGSAKNTTVLDHWFR